MMGRPNIGDIKEEWKEMLDSKSPKEMMEELDDVLHSALRYIRVPNRIVWFLAHPTARKHAKRVLSRGCPRSERNCKAAEKCCCK